MFSLDLEPLYLTNHLFFCPLSTVLCPLIPMPKPVPPHLFDQLASLLHHAKACGAEAADGVVVESSRVDAAVRHGRLSDLERSEHAEIGLRVLVGRQQASLSANLVDARQWPGVAADLAAQAVAMARLAPEDPYAGLADAADFVKNPPDLDLFDSTEVAAESLIEAAKTMEAVARAHTGITNVENASASWGMGGFAFMTSNGFSGGYRSTSHSLSIEAVAGQGTEMVRDYEWASTRHAADLWSPEKVAQLAATQTLSRLHARKMPTAKLPVVFAPRVAGSLVQAVLAAINGAAIARKTSFLQGQLGQSLFAPEMMIYENPHAPRGLRSRPFDGEGLACTPRALVEKGVLTTWLLNTSAARQLGLKSTGHASRGTSGVPGIGASNVWLANGSLSPEQLIADIKEGFYVTETMGFGVNNLTGDYSQGAAGFWIENGQISFPVHEMTIASHLADMFKTITPANDLEPRFGIDAPTLRVEGMMVAGS